MVSKYWQSALLAAPLLLGVGCTSQKESPGDQVIVGPGSDPVQVTVHAQYEKRSYSNGTLGPAAPQPIRYAYVQLRRSGDDALLGEGDLDGTGKTTIAVPRGSNCYAAILADVFVPSGSSFILNGSVLDAVPSATYSLSNFKQLPVWNVTSSVFSANDSGDISVQALESNGRAGAFAIADRMVDFALGMNRLESNLPLANLHAFWSQKDGGTGYGYPYPIRDANKTILQHDLFKRPMLACEVPYPASDWQAIVNNDGQVMETFVRSIFANGSVWETQNGQTNHGVLVRADNDNVFQDLGFASEASTAFMNGYAQFLSCAFKNNANVYSVPLANQTANFRLDSLSPIEPKGGGEFYGASVACSLWDIWKNSLGGDNAGLRLMWDAANPTLAKEDYEYGKTTRACYPTYLVGLKRLAKAAQVPEIDAGLTAALGRENIGNGLDVTIPGPNSPYYAGSALWENSLTLPLIRPNQTLVTYRDPVYYDYNQSRAYQVYCGDGTLDVTLNSSHPLLVEIFDSKGFLDYYEGVSGTLTLTQLPAGAYLIRVRVDPFAPKGTYLDGECSYTLTVQ